MEFQISASPSRDTWVILLSESAELSQQLTQWLPSGNIEQITTDFKAAKKQVQLIYGTSPARVYLVGLGKQPTAANMAATVRSFFHKNKKTLPPDISLIAADAAMQQQLAAVANGIGLASYDIGFLKTTPTETPSFNDEMATVEVVTTTPNAQFELQKGYALAETQCRLMRVVDSPANYKTPQHLADFVQASGEKYGYEVKVLDEKQCLAEGLHALLAVGKGSVENPPRFLILSYRPAAAAQKPVIGLVGKGVTFDTGGISIKPSDGMQYMKSDMGGAAAVIGTLEVAAKRQLPINLIGIIPTTENCVDGLAIKPGDVIQSYAGKTIEVIDTDAEGRLILADGLAYINKNYSPEVIVDLATLTGSCIRALGYVAAGLLSNNDALADQLYAAGQATGEKVWRLPLWDDYQDMLNSDVADIKNLTAAPLAGAITAAKFLEFFIDKHPAWAHLDIAGTAFGDSEFAKMKSATAYGIALLINWLEATYN